MTSPFVLAVTQGLRRSFSFVLGVNTIGSNITGDYRPNKYKFVGEIRDEWVENGGQLLSSFAFDEPVYDATTQTTIIIPVIEVEEIEKLPYKEKRSSPNAKLKIGDNAYVFEIRAKKLDEDIWYSVFQGYIEMGVSGVVNGD